MKFSEQQQRIALRKPKISKRYLLASPIAVVLGIWAPFYPKYLASAAVAGGIMGFIFWYGFRSPPQSPKEVFPAQMWPTFLIIFWMMVSKGLCLPRDMSTFHQFLTMFEAIGILFIAWGMTILLLGARYKKELENVSAPVRP